MNNIHPTAVVDPSAKLDPSVKVGPYSVIREDVVVGAGSVIGAHAVLEFVHMGKENQIFDGAYVGTTPQDLKYAGERTLLVMGDRNKVREGATLNRGTAALGETKVGSDCLFMTNSHVAHDCQLGNGVILANCVALAGHVEVGDGSIFGGLVAVHQYVRVGRYCMLGGGSMVDKDIPSFCNVQGDRATLRGLNLIGMRRAGLHRDAVAALREAYRTLFLSGRPWEEALAEVRSSSVPEVQDMTRMIDGSKRGITRPAAGAHAEEEAPL